SMTLAFLPKSWHDEVLNAPFSLMKYLRMHARLATVAPDYSPRRCLEMMNGYIHKEEWRREHHPDPRSLTDDELKLAIRKFAGYEYTYNDDIVIWFCIWIRDSVDLLRTMIDKWYDGQNAMAFPELMMGAT